MFLIIHFFLFPNILHSTQAEVEVCIQIYILFSYLKFGDGDGPNLCRVKKVDVSSKLIENIFRSGLTRGGRQAAMSHHYFPFRATY